MRHQSLHFVGVFIVTVFFADGPLAAAEGKVQSVSPKAWFKIMHAQEKQAGKVPASARSVRGKPTAQEPVNLAQEPVVEVKTLPKPARKDAQ